MINRHEHKLDDHMTTEVALLRAMLALREKCINDPAPRDLEALQHLRRVLDHTPGDEHEPGCDRLTRAIDVWIYG